MDLKRIRKAIIAGVGVFAAAITSALMDGSQPASPEGWGALLGGALVGAVLAGIATYRIRNAGTVNGSDPEYDLGDVASGNLPVYRQGRYPQGGGGGSGAVG